MSILKSVGAGGQERLTIEYFTSQGWFFKKRYDPIPPMWTEDEVTDWSKLYKKIDESKDEDDERNLIELEVETTGKGFMSQRIKLDKDGFPTFIYTTGWTDVGTGYFENTRHVVKCKLKTKIEFGKIEALWQANNYLEYESMVRALCREPFSTHGVETVKTGFSHYDDDWDD